MGGSGSARQKGNRDEKPSMPGLLYKHVAIIEQESVTLMFLPSQYIQFGEKDDRELG